MKLFAEQDTAPIPAVVELSAADVKEVSGGGEYGACVISCSQSLPSNASNAQLNACVDKCVAAK